MIEKKNPKFRHEDRKSDWVKRDSTKVIDEWKARREKLKNLKPSGKTICVRLPESLLDDLKLMASKLKIPYQSLLKILLAERLEQEFVKSNKE